MKQPARWREAVAAAALAAVLVVGGALALREGRDVSRAIDRAESDGQMHELLEVRARLAWVHFDLLVDGLSSATVGAEPEPERLITFHELRGAALDDLEALAELDSPAGRAASELTRVYEDEPFESWPYPAEALDTQHYASVDRDIAGRVFDLAPVEGDAIYATMLPLLVTADALVVELSGARDEPPAWLGEYYDHTLDVVTATPGWVGPERAAPMIDSVVLAGPEGSTPPMLDGVATDHLGRLWDYDQWLVAAAPNDFATPPPFGIDELARTNRAANAELRPAVIDGIRRSAERAGAAASPATASLFIVLGLSLWAGATVMGGVVIARLLSRHRRIEAAASTDALTGARNRRHLAEDIAGRCQRRGYHHVVAMIDLDRFKMINDTYGHKAGDELLVEVVRRLRSAVAGLTAGCENAVGEVVRQGGDEFVVALHSPDRFDLTEVERVLRGVEGPFDIGSEESVTIELSVGLAETCEPADLNDLLRVADLATYDDKRARRATRQGAVGDQRLDLRR